MNLNNLDQINQFASKLTTEQINNLSEEVILRMAMERPGHPGAYGFLLQPSYFKPGDHLSKTLYALMMRLQKVDNLKEKMEKR